MSETAIENPLLIASKMEDGGIMCRTYTDQLTKEGAVVMLHGLVKHIALTFRVEENEIWDALKQERATPTFDCFMEAH